MHLLGSSLIEISKILMVITSSGIGKTIEDKFMFSSIGEYALDPYLHDLQQDTVKDIYKIQIYNIMTIFHTCYNMLLMTFSFKLNGLEKNKIIKKDSKLASGHRHDTDL
ncbi:hypothetical protein ACJX0J_022359 [Zea mays]